MDQQKIDRLFREKLDSFEATPSDQAWSVVEKKIGARRNPVKFYWIAASISAIIISWVVWPKDANTDFTPIASEVNHPILDKTPEWSIQAVTKETEEEKEMKAVQPKTVNPPAVQLVAQEPVKNEIKETAQEEIKAPVEELNLKTAVAEVTTQELEASPNETDALEVEEPVQEKIKVDLSKVRITYIAANAEEKKQEKDSVGAFKKFIAMAGKLSPGDVLADLKTKKDDFINGGFKSKEKDRTSL